MLKKRIVPIILFDGNYCVQTTRFERPARRLGPVDQYVLNMGNRNIDELIIIDIESTYKNKEINFKQIKKFTSNLFCPVTYGGGIQCEDSIKKLIQDCGVDKVAIKTHFRLIEKAATKFGAQSIVYAMDCWKHHSNGSFFVHQMGKSVDPILWSRRMQNDGAGEILLTSMDKQGLMLGYSRSLINLISRSVTIPLIANGGCGSVEHMVQAFEAGADAVAASSVYALTGLTPHGAARGLRDAGVAVRVPGPQERRHGARGA